MLNRLICCFLVVLLLPSKVLAWGQVGHRIVGQIAWLEMQKKTKKEVQKILGKITLADSATWPDEIRSEHQYDHCAPWHYASIDDGKDYLTMPRSVKGDIVEALTRMEDTLRSKTASEKEKSEALKFMVHFMGDLHQPLHMGRVEDRGGNSIKVQWFDKETNLHSVWDESMVEFEKYSFSEYANLLVLAPKDEKESYYKGHYADWGGETLPIRASLYPNKDPNKDPKKGEEILSWGYHHQFKDLMRERLLKAGVRLAFVLDSIFSDKPLRKEDLDLREKIKNLPTRP